MEPGLRYVSLFCLGTGIAIIGFWTVILLRRALPRLLPVPGARDHVLAEALTGTLLLAAGIALLVEEAAWTRPLAGLALGATAYALAGSPGMYPREQRMLRTAFLVGWVFLIPAIVALLVST